jgi:hypothetical protein
MAGPLKPKIFNCPSCGANLEINALGYSATLVCHKCQSSIDISHPLPQLIQKYNSNMTTNPNIPIGSFGLLRGLKWKVIGFVVRKDTEYDVKWNEYLLYNPYNGFRFLVEIDAHFTLVESLNFNPNAEDASDPSQISMEPYGEFKIYNRGKAKVEFVVGEFYWRIKKNDTVKMNDYICPPYMISSEGDKQEITFSLGEYIPYHEIEAAFKNAPGLNIEKPWKITANQPNPYQTSFSSIMKIYSFSLAALVCLAMYFIIAKRTQHIASYDLLDSDFSSAQKEFISPSFDLSDHYGNVEVRLSSAVTNQWLSSDIALVNEATGEEFKSTTGVEFYSGYDDGYWSEGSKSNSEIISSIPSGRYHAEVSAETDMANKAFHLEFYRNGSMAVNFWLTLFGLTLYPIWVLWRRRAFEMSRWENSDYSPFYGPGTLNDFKEAVAETITKVNDD